MKRLGLFIKSLFLALFIAIPILILGIIVGGEASNSGIDPSGSIWFAVFYLVVLSFIVSYSNYCAEERGFGLLSLILWLGLFIVAYVLSIVPLVDIESVTGDKFGYNLFDGFIAAFLPTTGICMFYYYRMLGTGEHEVEGGSFIADTFGLLKKPLLIYLACAVVETVAFMIGSLALVYIIAIGGGVFGVASVIFMRFKNGSILY